MNFLLIKNICRIIISTFVLIFFASCEESITIDLEDIDQQIVITGIITDQPNASRVNITQTENVFKQSSASQIIGAKVSISDDAGRSEYLTETSRGNFVFNSIYAQQGRSYRLHVEYNGKNYVGNSKLNPPLALDSIRFERTLNNIIFGISYYAYKMKIYITNPKDTEDYCVIKIKDGSNQTARAMVVYSDKYSNGKQSIIEVSSIKYQKNEIVNIEVQTVDKAAYEYFYQLNELSTNRGIEVPDIFNINTYNPKSNLSNGALGYFYAYSYKKYQAVVK